MKLRDIAKVAFVASITVIATFVAFTTILDCLSWLFV